MYPTHAICKCGKKLKKVVSIQKLCKDCQIERNLKLRGKDYQERIKREAEENA